MERFTNPLTKMDYPDPDVIRVNDTYYMISTTMYFMPGGAILRSYDLLEWEIAGYLFDSLDDSPEERMEQERTMYGGGMWAPCLRYHDGIFYVAFVSHTSKTTYLFRSKNIEGPWEKSVIEGYYHDCSLLFDDDGKKYIVYGNREIYLTELNDDLTGPKKGGVHKIIIRDTDAAMLGYEGSHIYKINGYYYVFLIHWPKNGMRTEACFRSKSIDGEFVGKDVLSDDRGYMGMGVAQGGIVDTVNGKWFGILFQDSGAVGRIPVLVPVTWVDDFPVFGVDGKVPNSISLSSSRPNYRYEPLFTSDRFVPDEDGNAILKPQWQWNHRPDNDLWRFLPEGGLEVTSGKICANMVHARNILTQRTYFPKCEAEVTIDGSLMNDGDFAGLCMLQSGYGMIGITKELQWYYLVKIVRRSDDRAAGVYPGDYMPGDLEAKIPLDGPEVTVCMKANFENMTDMLSFYYNKNNRFVKVGDAHKMAFNLNHFTGNRFGLALWSTRKTGGRAVFKNFIYDI